MCRVMSRHCWPRMLSRRGGRSSTRRTKVRRFISLLRAPFVWPPKWLVTGFGGTIADGWTALHAAAYSTDDRCVALLLQCGATATVADNNAQTPAIVASAQGAPRLASVLLGNDSVDILLANHSSDSGGRLSSGRGSVSTRKRGRTGGLRTPSPVGHSKQIWLV
jgi:hypothetical protein